MPRASKQAFKVNVFRPNGWLLKTLTINCSRSDVAKNRAKQRIASEGRLAHFYTYVVQHN